jgi:hypothetical protein
MDEVYHAKPFSMAFCLECHRDPASRIRPLDKVTDLEWAWHEDPEDRGRAAAIAKARNLCTTGTWNPLRAVLPVIDEDHPANLSRTRNGPAVLAQPRATGEHS